MAIKGKTVAVFANTCNMLEKKDVIEKCRQIENDVDIFITNKGSNSLENLGIEVEAKFYDYDYVVVINPFKKSADETENTLVHRQRYYLNNILFDKEYLEKEIGILEDSSVEGILVPPIDYIKSIDKDLYKNWKDFYEPTENIVKENQLEVVVSKDRAPVISEGGCYIVKTSAIKGFENLKLADYRAEVFAYVMSLYMQSNGYLSGYTIKKSYMVNNLLGYDAVSKLPVPHSYPTRLLESEVYFDTGNGFDVSEVLVIESVLKIGKKEKVKFKLDVPQGTKYIRFDPCEGNMCLCSEVKTDVGDIKIHNVNGLRFGKEDLFLTKDPQYILEGDFSQIKKLTITLEYISVFWSENGLKDEMDKVFEEKEELIKAVDHLKNAYGELERNKSIENAELKHKLEEQISVNAGQQGTIEVLQVELDTIKASKGWRIICKLRNIKRKVLRK